MFPPQAAYSCGVINNPFFSPTSEPENIKYYKSLNGWLFHCSSIIKLKLLINYLNRYGLKTKKSLAFTKWCKIHQRVWNKEHLTVIGLEKIDFLTKQINMKS